MKIKYRAVIAIVDGQPDSSGDILTDNVKIPNRRLMVSRDFSDTVVGFASVKKEGNELVAEIELDDSQLPPELAEQLVGVVGGYIISRNGTTIDSWKLQDIGLTVAPCDKRLPKLKKL